MASAARGVTFCTDRRSLFFVQEAPVALVRAQILCAAREIGFEISAYCFMPDHLHLLVSGLHESSDAKLFISRSKQFGLLLQAPARRAFMAALRVRARRG